MREISKNQLQMMLICSFRYALGRSTYITSDVADLVKQHHSALRAFDRESMIKDIDHAIEHDIAGMDCDKTVWIELRDFLKGI